MFYIGCFESICSTWPRRLLTQNAEYVARDVDALEYGV
jgi:hypothetical protein